MKRQIKILLIVITITTSFVSAQTDEYTPDPETVLQLIRNDKMELVLPRAMQDNNIDMWIHTGRAGDPNPLEYEFGVIDGFLILTNTSGKIERAMFGGIFTGSGGVEKIDHYGSMKVARAFGGYDPFNVDISVYDEIRDYVAERDPKTIAVNFSDWLAVADGISHSQYLKLEKILGTKYASRIVSAENLITDFRSHRTLREITVQVNELELYRQKMMKAMSKVVPGETAVSDIPGCRLLYSTNAETGNSRSRNSILQRGDFFLLNSGSNWMDFGDNSFTDDTKYYGYILKEGEREMPKELKHAYDQAIAGQWIMRSTIKVGMTSGDILKAMIKSMEDAGYIYTPFVDDGSKDREIIRKALANTNKSGFSVDLHVQGNHNGELITVGPSMAPFRRDRDHLVIKENHIFAFEYMVHSKVPGREDPLSINVSNVQAVSKLGVEWIQPPNEGVYIVE